MTNVVMQRIGEVGEINQDTGEKPWIMTRGCKIEPSKDLRDHVIPVVKQTAKSIQGFTEEPILILVKCWVSHWTTYDSELVIWEGSLTKMHTYNHPA